MIIATFLLIVLFIWSVLTFGFFHTVFYFGLFYAALFTLGAIEDKFKKY